MRNIQNMASEQRTEPQEAARLRQDSPVIATEYQWYLTRSVL